MRAILAVLVFGLGCAAQVTQVPGGGGGGAPSGAAGGDLGGTYPDPTVLKLNSVLLSSLNGPNCYTAGVPHSCTFSELLTLWTGTKSSSTVPLGDGTMGTVSNALAGDVTGTAAASVVQKINGTALSGLATGLLKNTTASGVPSIAVAGTDYVGGQASLSATGCIPYQNGSSGLLTCDSGFTFTAANSPAAANLLVTRSYAGTLLGLIIENTNTSNAVYGGFQAGNNSAVIQVNGQSKGGTTIGGVANASLSYLQFSGNNTMMIATQLHWVTNSTIRQTIDNSGNVTNTLGTKGRCTSGSNATCGTATLSSGAVTVSTTAIASGDKVRLTLQTCSTCGAISVGTVTAGTSFIVNSTNGADASVVFWEIVGVV